MRLIDADAMLETLNRKYPQWYTGKPKDSLKHYAWLVYYWAVREAPTIDAVPATIEGALGYLHKVGWMQEHDRIMTEDVAPRWIPCEERLPESNVAVLGYAPKFNNIFTVCYDRVCGWMTWCPACDEPFPSWQGEIVAWMPLPEPYEGERKDDDKSCATCKHYDSGWDDATCDGCTTADSRWERKDDE